MGNTQFTSKQPDIINSNISACKISDLVEETTGIQGDTASASDIWFLKLKQPINYDNNDIKYLFLKYTIDTKELNYITDYLNIDLKESDIDIKSFFNYNMNQLNAVEYEMKVYNDIIKQLIDNNICPNFVKCISVGNSCSYNDLLNILTNNDGTLIDSDGKKIPDCVSELLLIRNLGFIINKSCYKRKNIKRPAINDFNKVNFNNEKYSSINCDKNDNGDECSLYRLNKNKNEFLKNLKFKFIINEKINNPITLDQLVNNINKGDVVFDDDVWFTLLQVAIGCYTLSLSKTAHNDLHLKNILIQQDHNKVEYKYIIGDNKNILAIKKEPKYKALIYDFDKSYSEQLCKNYDLNDLNKYSIDNKVIENRDLVKVLVYVYSIIKDEEIKEKILKCFCKDEHLDWGRNNLNYNWYLQKSSTNVEETININNNVAVQTVNDNNSSNNAETPEETVEETPEETAEENTETPEENAETPEENAETPEENAETPEETAETPEETAAETPEETAETPEETVNTPNNSVNTPNNSVNTPNNSVNTPNNSVNTPNNNEETTNKPNQNGGAKYLDEALDEKVYSEKFFNSFQIITNISNPDNIKNLIFTDNLANLLDNNDLNNLPFICIPDLFENNGTIKLLKNTKLIINSLLINNLEKSRINNDFYNENVNDDVNNDNDQEVEENDQDDEEVEENDQENDDDDDKEVEENDEEVEEKDEENNEEVEENDQEVEKNNEEVEEDVKNDEEVEEKDEENEEEVEEDVKNDEENDEETKNKKKLKELEEEKKKLNAALEKLNEN